MSKQTYFPGVSPSFPADDQPAIGIIGMGHMGRMYARRLSEAGWLRIHVCDQPKNYAQLKADYANAPGIVVHQDGHAVSRTSDFIMYCVEAEFVERVVATYGPSTKVGAVVGGQTSVKAPEIAAFEKHLPGDIQIVTIHSLHGPTVSPVGQPLVIIQHRACDAALRLVENILRCFESRYVHLSAEEHDLVTANTQAVTHAAFLSMGTAWSSAKSYPWEEGFYVGGIETVKVNIMLRIYANQWHTYAGLAILNPPARLHIDQYANSTTEIFKLMLNHNEDALRERMYRAKEKVFGPSLECGGQPRRPILLSESVLDKFSLGKRCKSQDGPGTNSHLSLLAMVDCWAHLNINPFEHLALAATPIFRLFLGVAETLFVSSIPESSPSSPTVEGSTDAERSLNGAETGRKSIIPPCPLCHPEMGVVASRLDVAIHAACQDMLRRSDDLEFTIAARGWSQCVSFGSFRVYQQRFEQTRLFFESRFEEANKLGAEMVKAVMETEVKE